MKYSEMRTTQVRLPPELKKEMVRRANEEGRSVQNYLRKLITDDLARQVNTSRGDDNGN